MNRQRVLVTAPGSSEFDDVREVLKNVITDLGAEYVRLDYGETGIFDGVRGLPGMLSDIFLVIADLTYLNPFVMMELGSAFAILNPIISLYKDLTSALK